MKKEKEDFAQKHIPGDIVLKSMPGLAYVFSKDGRLVLWNNNLERTVGYSKEELLNKHMDDFVVEDYRPLNNEAFNKVFTEQTDASIEYSIVTKSGKKIPIIDSGCYANIEGEEYVIGQAIDITRLKNTEKKLITKILEIEKLRSQLEEENIFLKKEVGKRHDFEEIIGQGEHVNEMLNRIRLIAPMNTPVLLMGETGTGKELAARAIHQKSLRNDKPFVKVDLSSIHPDLVECILFGCERNAMPGAVKSRTGKIVQAHEGTLFLDSIDKLPLELQSKLLRLVETGEFERIGDPQTLKADVRIICATTQNLNVLIEQEVFRENLYFLLSVYSITIAPLRERPADIPLLVRHFVEKYNRKHNKRVKRFTKAVIKKLENYPWPGNIRELESVIERSVIISPATKLVLVLQQSSQISENKSFLPLGEFEKKYIKEILKFTKGRIEGTKGAARILDIHPETLRSKMRKMGIKRKG